VLPPTVPKLAVEAASSFGWHRFVDDVVSIDTFGASAPGQTVLEAFGINAANVIERARRLSDRAATSRSAS
jgi:transketolase